MPTHDIVNPLLYSTMIKTIHKIVCLSLTCFFLQSCIFEGEKECAWEYYGNLKIINHWENSPLANPEGMAYFFYPSQGGDYWRFDIPGREGGEIKIPAASYNLLLFNDDTTWVVELDDKNYYKASLSTMPGYLFSLGNDPKNYPDEVVSLNQPILFSPDDMWSYSLENINVEPSTTEQIIDTYPIPITATYHVIVNNVSNLDGVSKMSGAMSGMAKSVELNSFSISDQPVIHPIQLEKGENPSISGTFKTFGRCSENEVKNMLFLFVKLTDKRQFVFSYDVSDIVKNAPDKMDVWIIIDKLELPESDPDKGNFDVSVDGWNSIYINL